MMAMNTLNQVMILKQNLIKMMKKLEILLQVFISKLAELTKPLKALKALES